MKKESIAAHPDVKERSEAGASLSPLEPETERSADLAPTIQSTEDLERVTSDKKPTLHPGLSEEAIRQIAPKLKPKRQPEKQGRPKRAA
jgi:hypothetical protein